MRTRSILSALALAAFALGCTEKRYTCEACLRDADGVCAKSGPLPVRREEDARCAAAEALCDVLDAARFEKLCKERSHSVMLGCSKELQGDLRIECTATTHINLPLLIDL